MTGRTHTVEVELSHDEWQTLNFMAELSGQTLESYLADFAADDARQALRLGEADPEMIDLAAEEGALLDQLNGYRVDRLIEAGKVLPYHREQVIAFAASLERRAGHDFAAGDDQFATVDWFWDFLEDRPPAISFGAADLPPEVAGQRGLAVNAPRGFMVDEGQGELYATARLIEKERGIPFAEAVTLAEAMLNGRG